MSEFDELRQIIIGDNSELLNQLKDRIESIDQRTRDVSEVLPPAIQAGVRKDSTLVESLQKPISMSLKHAIRTEPKAYAEILYPVMSPLIRRAISQAISSLMITINKTVEQATSVKGLGLRLKALRSGIPYAELALRKSVIYRVEHVYLIDHESGMRIEDVTSQNVNSLDSDAVSAMFSAIQSFVQDSFSHDQNARLTDLKVGEYKVWVAHGHKVMLACVIVGDAPESLKDQLYDALDSIRSDFAPAIAAFDGDSSAFEGVDEYLKPLLQLELKDDVSDKNKTGRKALLPLILLSAALAYFAYGVIDKNTKINSVERYLSQAPGIAVTSAYWDDERIIVEGLQDPDAIIPYGKLEDNNVSADQLVLKTIPFRSLEVDMELQRFKKELELPRGVYLGVRDSRIFLYGEAPIFWLINNDVRLRQLSADRRLDISTLSASFESVSDLLRRNFSGAELSGIKMSSVVGEFSTAVQIGGQMEASKLALLKAIFAANNWVNVTAAFGPPSKQPELIQKNGSEPSPAAK